MEHTGLPLRRAVLRGAREATYSGRRRHEKAMGETAASSLFERLGGYEAVFATVTSFYDRIMADPTLAPFFTHLDMSNQIDKQVAFLTFAFGGPSRYEGRDLRTAHARAVASGLNGTHFAAVAGHLQATLQSLNVPQPLIDEVMT